MLNFKGTPAQTIVDCAYYFCKFQQGTEKFWQKLEEELDVESLQIGQMARLSLALVMNNRAMTPELVQKVFGLA